MADIRENGWEWFHYDNPDFQVQFRRNWIPANTTIRDIKIHWHDDVEFIYVLKGVTHYEMEDTNITMKAGEGIFVNARQLHLIHSDVENECELLCLIFHPIILCSTEYVAANYVRPLIDNKNIPYVHLKCDVPWQEKVLSDIAKMEQYCDKEGGHIRTMNYILDIWDTLFKNLVEEPDKDKVNEDLACTKKMVAYIHKNYHGKIKLQDICEVGNVGRSKCNELFDKYYNMSPIEYVKNYRIEQGAKLLNLTDMSITDIAYEVGFSDGSYFSKAFSDKIGITPFRYRSIGREMSRYYELPESQNL